MVLVILNYWCERITGQVLLFCRSKASAEMDIEDFEMQCSFRKESHLKW